LFGETRRERRKHDTILLPDEVGHGEEAGQAEVNCRGWLGRLARRLTKEERGWTMRLDKSSSTRRLSSFRQRGSDTRRFELAADVRSVLHRRALGGPHPGHGGAFVDGEKSARYYSQDAGQGNRTASRQIYSLM